MEGLYAQEIPQVATTDQRLPGADQDKGGPVIGVSDQGILEDSELHLLPQRRLARRQDREPVGQAETGDLADAQALTRRSLQILSMLCDEGIQVRL